MPPLPDVMHDLTRVLRAHPDVVEVVIAEGALYGTVGAPIAETLRRLRALEEVLVPRGITLFVDAAPVVAPWIRVRGRSAPTEAPPPAEPKGPAQLAMF